jgi:hypothetical protein
MARFLIKTAYDSVDCDYYVMVSDECIEVGYEVDGKFRHEKIVSEYFRIVDHYPELDQATFELAFKAQEDMNKQELAELKTQLESLEPPLDTAHNPEEEKKKPKKGQLLFENASFYG